MDFGRKDMVKITFFVLENKICATDRWVGFDYEGVTKTSI